VTNATDLNTMFYGCAIFNADLARWDVANATDLNGMFQGCTSFSSDLSRWNVANADDLDSMFEGCTSFNSDLSRWNVANASDFCSMFDGCTSFIPMFRSGMWPTPLTTWSTCFAVVIRLIALRILWIHTNDELRYGRLFYLLRPQQMRLFCSFANGLGDYPSTRHG
jgi:surface protein